MKTIQTLLGPVNIIDVRMSRASGYGQYTISIEIKHEGKPKKINAHSTDSQLFDDVHGKTNHAQLLLERAEYQIEREINDYISSL